MKMTSVLFIKIFLLFYFFIMLSVLFNPLRLFYPTSPLRPPTQSSPLVTISLFPIVKSQLLVLYKDYQITNI